MRSPIHWSTLYLVALCLAAGQMAFYYPLLPSRMATHFGPSGMADGWMSKDSFLLFYGFLMVCVGGLLAGVAISLGKLPPDLINLPNREYWLAPERRAATVRVLETQMGWFGAATLVLLIAMMQLTFRANLTIEPHLDNRAMLLVFAYIGYTLFWTGSLIYRFSRQR